MTLQTTITVAPGQSGRLDKQLAQLLPTVSRSQLQKWIDDGQVLVNGQAVKAKFKVKVGDVIQVDEPAPQTIDLAPEKMPLEIVYEDEDVLVVNKPQGMVVHPAAGHPNHTLVNGLLYHSPLSTINGEFRPGIVHRIDKDTSGLLMVAKNDVAHQSLAAQLKAKTTAREYVALVHGVIQEQQGTINAPLARSPKDRKKQAVVADGRAAVTHFRVLERFAAYTLVACRLETGRTHQIRVHMKYINHPLAGDPLYGPRKTLPGAGQYLHARLLGFQHPKQGRRVTVTAPLPAAFQAMIEKLRKTAPKQD
ncbi:RluA family pseudouridine synthase [Limosilactobacillus ingluviei]|uniref:Pseudouridine synthase n=1 Tax=Limosilactobacillus ingluviei TaxID=148604 RepID=A0A0R2GYS2_9LACO|nr:RluA family pseudouridine synthase [Limosilactobacillus ingluviei]KRN45454.1 ribosomal large subunit pseudouridine synthase D [Limosilactobacillus ingluviei]MDO4602995.1 RluA family pseudouridine synthase [Limosilactobacillus ingluviei]